MSPFKHSLTYSLASVLFAIALGMVMYSLSMFESPLYYFSYAGFIAFTVFGLKAWREKIKGGYITFGQAMGYATYMALVFSVLMGIWTYIYYGYIAHDEITALQDARMEESMQMMREKYHMPEAQIESSMKFGKMFTSPGLVAVLSVFGNMLILTIVNLIVAAIMKKDPPFSSAGQFPEGQFPNTPPVV